MGFHRLYGLLRWLSDKEFTCQQETHAWSLGQEDALEWEMATHSSILAWEIPWMDEPDSLQSIRSQRDRCKWVSMHRLCKGCSSVIPKTRSAWIVQYAHCNPMGTYQQERKTKASDFCGGRWGGRGWKHENNTVTIVVENPWWGESVKLRMTPGQQEARGQGFQLCHFRELKTVNTWVSLASASTRNLQKGTQSGYHPDISFVKPQAEKPDESTGLLTFRIGKYLICLIWVFCF